MFHKRVKHNRYSYGY